MNTTDTRDRHHAIEELDRQIVTMATTINAATYRFLVLVREFDERAGFLKWSLDSCAQWLHWRCDLSPAAARERVRVAHALKELPAISAAFEKGVLSYSKVRALTRVATAASERRLLDFALTTTAARVEERCRQMRNTTASATDELNRRHAGRALHSFRNAGRGTLTLTVELPLEDGELIVQALEKAMAEHGSNGPEFESTPFKAQQADALVDVARAFLAGGDERDAGGTAQQFQVLVHVDKSALAGNEGRSDLPVESVRRLLCDGSLVTLEIDGSGEPLSVGRRQRTVPAAIRRALHARDRHCRFPGCHHHKYLHAHHIQHWSQGGETSLANLVLLCSRHHRLVHEGGYQMRRDLHGQWYFRRVDGRAVPALGYRVDDIIDEDTGATAGCSPPGNPSGAGASAEAGRCVTARAP